MSDREWETNDYLNYIGQQTERVAAALEKTLLLLETLAVRKAPTAPTGPYYPATWASSQPVIPVYPRDPRPSTITC